MNNEKINKYAVAKYNMEFDNGRFIKNKKYKYKENPAAANNVVFITTEEGTEQDLLWSEFNMLFVLS